MIPRRKMTVRNPKNDQYDIRPDGSLLCGPACFSKLNVLKVRFATEKLAVSRKTDKQDVYKCDYCKGFHLTHKSKKGKKR